MLKNIFLFLFIIFIFSGCGSIERFTAESINNYEKKLNSIKVRAQQQMTCNMNILNNDLLFEGHSEDLKLSIKFAKESIYNTIDISKFKIGKNGLTIPKHVLGISINDNTKTKKIIFLINPKGYMAYENINGFIPYAVDEKGNSSLLLINMECKTDGMLIREPYFKLINDGSWKYK